MDIEAFAKNVEGRVKVRAIELFEYEGVYPFAEALEQAAKEIVPPRWEWRVSPYIGPPGKDAEFNLTLYNGDWSHD